MVGDLLPCCGTTHMHVMNRRDMIMVRMQGAHVLEEDERKQKRA